MSEYVCGHCMTEFRQTVTTNPKGILSEPVCQCRKLYMKAAELLKEVNENGTNDYWCLDDNQGKIWQEKVDTLLSYI